MLELNISQNNNQFSHAYKKWYGRVEYKRTLTIDDMARHMAEHNTPFSVGTIAGILKDFVSCTREQCLNGNTVKIDDLAIFKCSLTGNGLTLGKDYKVVAGLGTVPTKGPDGTGSPDFTKQAQYAVGSVRLLAQATGDFTKKELNGDATFRWTKAAQQTIDAIVKPEDSTDGGEGGGGE